MIEGSPSPEMETLLFRNARAAAITVAEYEESAFAGGPPVPDILYLNLAKTTETASRAFPDYSDAKATIAAQAIVGYLKAGAFEAARRLAYSSLLCIKDNEELSSHINDLLDEANQAVEKGDQRMLDPFDKAKISGLVEQIPEVSPYRILPEEIEIADFEKGVGFVSRREGNEALPPIRGHKKIGIIYHVNNLLVEQIWDNKLFSDYDKTRHGFSQKVLGELFTKAGEGTLDLSVLDHEDMDYSRVNALTPLEIDVIERYISGKGASSAIIGRDMGLSDGYIKLILFEASEKLGVRGRIQTAVFYKNALYHLAKSQPY